MFIRSLRAKSVAVNKTDKFIKPRVLESKVSDHEKFFNLTDSFKKVFTSDKKDEKIVIPVCGYGGHRRGDRC